MKIQNYTGEGNATIIILEMWQDVTTIFKVNRQKGENIIPTQPNNVALSEE